MNIACDTLIAYPNMYAQNYTIPNGVKVIGPAAFGSCYNLLSVTFPEGVTTIDVSAFSACINLQAVSLCSSITSIGSSAFYFCESLTSFYIPANVATIGSGAFNRCEGMTEIQVDDSNPNFMDDYGVLYTSDGTRLIQYPCARPEKHYSVLNTTSTIDELAFGYTTGKSVYLPKSLRNLESYTFAYSEVERIVIDEGLENIPERTFFYCEHLKSIYLPSTIKSIGDQAFYYSVNLEDITFAIDGNAPTIGIDAFYGLAYSTDNKYANVYVPSGMASKYAGLSDWLDVRGSFTDIETIEAETTFTIDSLAYKVTDANLNTMVTGVTSDHVDPGISPKVAYQGNLCTVNQIKDHAFANLSKMVRAEVPFTVQLIDNYTFYNCKNLEKLILRDGIRQIGGFAFSHINKLTNVEIPASVDSIRGDAFTYDPALRYINVKSGNAKYASEDGILFSKDKKQLIAFADGYGPQYTVPDGTQSIELEAFRGAQALEAVVLPNSLRQIKNSAFFDCSSLTEMAVPHGVTNIGNSAFSGCTSLTSADLPATLTELGYNAFYNVPNLTNLNVRATTPPTCLTYLNPRTHEMSEPFIDNHYSNVSLVVPLNCAQAYREANIWTKFTHISETNFPTVFLRGDVNDDGAVNISDAIALINSLLNDNYSNINLDAADVNEDGNINVSDAITLINYLLNDTWPEPAPIDMWYLIGTNVGSNPWENSSMSSVGSGLLPLYPQGQFDNQGHGILTYTGYFGANDYFMLIHTPGQWENMWGMDRNGNYVQSTTGASSNCDAIHMGSDGYYTITANTKTNTLTIEPYQEEISGVFASITMPGTENYWNNTATPMAALNTSSGVENHDWWLDQWTLTSTPSGYGDVKFCAYDDWEYNWGDDSFPYGTGINGGLNIPANKGTYTVFFNDITGQYNFIKK